MPSIARLILGLGIALGTTIALLETSAVAGNENGNVQNSGTTHANGSGPPTAPVKTPPRPRPKPRPQPTQPTQPTTQAPCLLPPGLFSPCP
jgi:hypothetical protein